MKKYQLHHCASAELAPKLADFVVAKAQESVQHNGRFSLSLSGGNTPRSLYHLFTQEPWRSAMPWDKTWLFWGDERCVPADHPDSNYRMARETFIDAVPVPAAQVLPMNGGIDPEKAASDYEKSLREYFADGKPEFDFMLLGIGDDGHTASLFPGTTILEEKERWVSAVFVPKMGVWRISLTLPVINISNTVAFMVADESKRTVLKQILEGKSDFPAAKISAKHGTVHWFTDLSGF